jgi:hypothetical protein
MGTTGCTLAENFHNKCIVSPEPVLQVKKIQHGCFFLHFFLGFAAPEPKIWGREAASGRLILLQEFEIVSEDLDQPAIGRNSSRWRVI